MLKELQTIFESVDKEILSEDVLKSIASLVEEQVNAKVDQRVTLELESALKSQHEKFLKAGERATKLIDEDHTAKIKKVVAAINENHSKKLIQIKEGYDKLLKEGAIKHRDMLVESVNDYLDMYIEKNLPRQEIAEAAKNQYAVRAIDEARKILGIDERYIKNNVKEALVDGKNQMDKLIKENATLKQKATISESKRFLAEHTANLPNNVAKFVKSRLDGKPLTFIKENFQYVIDMYGRKEKNEKRAAMINEGKTINVDRTRVADELLRENTDRSVSNTNSANNPMDMYLDAMNFRK